MTKEVGRIVGIYTAPDKGQPMISRLWVIARKRGLMGDRYFLGKGAYSKSRPPKVRDVTLIAQSAIDGSGFTSPETRRNLVVAGITPEELNALAGREFMVGRVRMRGTELADPCQRPSALSGKPGFPEAFAGKGGVRAEILGIGFIRRGSKLRIV